MTLPTKAMDVTSGEHGNVLLQIFLDRLDSASQSQQEMQVMEDETVETISVGGGMA